MDVVSTVRRYIADHFLQSRAVELTEDLPLIEEGYITSLEAVELVTFLEEEFHIEIGPEEVNEEAFRSLRSIAKLVERKQTEQAVR